jgi:uncharacterized protein YidB (DUF937 family)
MNLDALLSSLMGGSTQGGGQGANPLMQIALQMLAGGGQGGGGAGGLQSLIQAFQQAGLGNQMNSWISTGQNMPISPDQLMQALGSGRMQQMAAQSGMDVGQLSGGLSQLLPQLIDGLTPGGQVPASGLDDALSQLSKMMPR